MKNLFTASLFIFLCQCTTAPKKPLTAVSELSDVGVWQGKALMINKKTKHKKWAGVTWVSDSVGNRMKINVYAVMDIPVASYLSSGKGSDLWLFTEERHYSSEDGAKLFKYLTKMAIDPAVFFNLLGHPKSPGAQWQCTDAKRVFRCRSAANNTTLSVTYDSDDTRKIEISRQDQLLKLNLTRSKVQVEDRHFKPISMPHYKTIKI